MTFIVYKEIDKSPQSRGGGAHLFPVYLYTSGAGLQSLPSYPYYDKPATPISVSLVPQNYQKDYSFYQSPAPLEGGTTLLMVPNSRLIFVNFYPPPDLVLGNSEELVSFQWF